MSEGTTARGGNGLDLAMFEALVAAGATLAADRSLRAVVLSGAGRAFSAGLDFASFMARRAEGRAVKDLLEREAGSPANFAQRRRTSGRRCPRR